MGKTDLRKYRQRLREVLVEDRRPLVPGEEPERCPDLDEEAAADHMKYVERCDEAIRYEQWVAAQHALDRMKEGAYGVCEDCGSPLSEKRLAAVPWATRCVPCQTEWESRHQEEMQAA